VRRILAWALLIGSAAAWSHAADSKQLLTVLADELDRNFRVLKEKGEIPPYFIGYTVTEQEMYSISGTLGVLLGENHRRARMLDLTVRVGTRKLDNYHVIRGEYPRFTAAARFALEDNPNAIKQQLWRETDRVYRLATQRLINIRTNKEVRVADLEESDDFSTEPAATYYEEPAALEFNMTGWSGSVRRLSWLFSKYPLVLSSQVGVMAIREVKYLVNTDGTRLAHGRPFSRVVISAQGKAQDGMDLTTFDSFSFADPKRLPKDAEIEKAIDRMAQDLTNLVKAPVVDAFVGPAILSGRAAGVFFHEIFGHRVEGHRLKDESDGQTFAKSVGQAVLPEFISVTFDPTLKNAASEDLNGWYLYDDEGIKGRRVDLVENGVLKTFLMSRTPIPGIAASNGHGRREPGAEVVARQSNLLVESNKSVSDNRLKEMLIEEVKKRGKPYGFYFQEITGGYTQTGRRGIQAFKVIPLVVYRIYPDGREELVRGADIVGTPLASFAKILATGDKMDVFNGYCGAESGSVPVSAVSPAILVSELEIQKRESSRDRPPLLPPPPTPETR
jgi:predicted Zn-dependent protease